MMIIKDFLLVFVGLECVVSKNFILCPSIKLGEFKFILSSISVH